MCQARDYNYANAPCCRKAVEEAEEKKRKEDEEEGEELVLRRATDVWNDNLSFYRFLGPR